MASSSGVRRIGARQYASVAANLGVSLPIPDGRAWPEDVRVWFHKATGECGPLDVFIFNHGQVACMYLQDAVTAAAILEVDASEWFTERGYPIFCFDPKRIGEIQHRLGIVGYTVHVLEPAEGPKRPSPRKRGKVLNIAVGREKARGEQAR